MYRRYTTRFLPFCCFIASFLFVGLSVTGCASKKETIPVAQQNEQRLYENAQNRLRSGNWLLAVEVLQILEENYPFGVYAEQAQLEIIYAYYRSHEYESAIAAADRFIRLHPQHLNVDYAYYMRGITAFYNDTPFDTFLPVDPTRRGHGSTRDAFNYFSQLIHKYPKSPYALDAQKRMLFIRNTFARAEIQVANYYFKRGAYAAAANRGRYVVENMPQTPAVPDGLAVMAQAYHLLGMDKLSEDAATVLASNYPSHPAVNQDGSFDYQFGREKKRSLLSYLTFGLFTKRPFVRYDSRTTFDHVYRETVATPPNTGATSTPRSSNHSSWDSDDLDQTPAG